MVLRRHPLRHGLRLPALLGQQHFTTVQEDPLRRVHTAQLRVIIIQGPAIKDPERQPIETLPTVVDLQPLVV